MPENLHNNGKWFTWRQLGLKHVHGNDVDDHNPNRTLEHIIFRLHQADYRQALRLEPAPVGICATQLAIDVRLELFHVENLGNGRDFVFDKQICETIEGHWSHFVNFFNLQALIRRLQDLTSDRCLLVQCTCRWLDENVALSIAANENIASIVHFNFDSLQDVKAKFINKRVT